MSTQTVWMLEEERLGMPGADCWTLLPYVFATEAIARASWELAWSNVPESERPPYRVTCMQVYAAPEHL